MNQGTEASENSSQQKARRNKNPVVIAYLFHLAVPAFLLLDVVTAWMRGEIALKAGAPDAIVGELSAVWLIAGIGALILSRDRLRFVHRISKPLLAIYAVYLVLMLTEGFLRLAIPAPIPGLQPRIRRVFSVDPNEGPGLHGTKTFTTNHLGLRGPMPPRRDLAYRIVAIGGSTTRCTILDDSEEWSHLLMEGMNASQKSTPVWVGNAGVAGWDTVRHLVLLQFLPGVLQVDMVIFMTGGIDMAETLNFEGAPTQALLEKTAGFHGDLPAGTRWRSVYPVYQRLRLFPLLSQAIRNAKQRFFRSGNELTTSTARERRAASPIVPMPDLHIGLEEYRRRLVSLAKRCQALDLRCLFLTQPSLWRSDLSPAEEHLLSGGYVGRWEKPKGYASAADLARAIDAYNRTLLDVCQQNGLECYNLATYIPKDTSAFYDEIHLNEAGARMVAQNLRKYLLSKPPFSTGQVESGPLSF